MLKPEQIPAPDALGLTPSCRGKCTARANFQNKLAIKNKSAVIQRFTVGCSRFTLTVTGLSEPYLNCRQLTKYVSERAVCDTPSVWKRVMVRKRNRKRVRKRVRMKARMKDRIRRRARDRTWCDAPLNSGIRALSGGGTTMYTRFLFLGQLVAAADGRAHHELYSEQ